MSGDTTPPLLEVDGLHMRFAHPHQRRQTVHAVDGVSFHVRAGETVGVVGESGSGKSTIGRCILGLEDASEGRIAFDGQEITHAKRRQRRRLAADLQVVFQDPYSSLNPYLTIAETLREPYVAATGADRGEADARARELLTRVGLPADAADRYPRQFSGGQRQRIAIARALMLSPKLVICDEAVSALDLSTQAQILNLLRELAVDQGLAYVFIAHDLDVVHYICDRTIVLYRGRVMEEGPSDQVHQAPLHPYTIALLSAAPVTDPTEQARRRGLRRANGQEQDGRAPSGPATGAAGCPFASRCRFAEDVCLTTRPGDTAVGERRVACHAFDAGSGHTSGGRGLPILAEAEQGPA